MISSGLILNILIVVGVLIAAAGVVGASFRSARNTSALQNLKYLSDSWKGKYEEQKFRNDEQDAKILELQSQNKAQEAQIKILTEITTGRAAVDKLINQVTELTARMDNRVDEALRGQRELRDGFAKLSKRLERQENGE